MRFFRQAGILMLKHAWVKKRHYISTLVDIVIPSALFLILVMVKGLVDFQLTEHPEQVEICQLAIIKIFLLSLFGRFCDPSPVKSCQLVLI